MASLCNNSDVSSSEGGLGVGSGALGFLITGGDNGRILFWTRSFVSGLSFRFWRCGFFGGLGGGEQFSMIFLELLLPVADTATKTSSLFLHK